VKSGGYHRFSLNKQLKLPYELCFSQKNQSTQKVQKIRFAKLIVDTLSTPSLLHNWPELTIISIKNFGFSDSIYGNNVLSRS
jgi:hypothetical protein